MTGDTIEFIWERFELKEVLRATSDRAPLDRYLTPLKAHGEIGLCTGWFLKTQLCKITL